jgi:ribonuclease VapC
MVIDTSAILALLCKEPERDRLAAAISADPARLVSSASVLETSIVIEARYGVSGAMDLDLLLHTMKAQIEPVTEDQARIGRLAYRQYGTALRRGFEFWGLLYALAKTSGQPLLFKGTDFSQTDLPVVSY